MSGARVLEAQFLNAVLDVCKLHGCLVHHCRPARKRDGSWATPIQGDPGFPDLVVVGRSGRVLFPELKTATGAVSAPQRVWLDRLGALGRVWRPVDLTNGVIVRDLRSIS